MRKIFTIIAVILMLNIPHQTLGQRTVTTNSIFTEGGFTYEFWRDSRPNPNTGNSGTGSMTTGPNGTFSATWSGVENILFRSGLRPGSLSQIVTYVATYSPTFTDPLHPFIGTSYLTLYGWTRNPLIEWYVVENWWNWRPPGGTPLGSFTSDGGTYDIFRTERVQQPSIDGTQTFFQFWSVRRIGRNSGTITFANHINAWRNHGMNMGTSLYEVSFCVEGFRNSGTANITSLVYTIGSPTNIIDPNSTLTNITVYPNPADDILSVRIDGQQFTNMTFNIYNSKGSLVNSSNNTGSLTRLDVSALPPGVYILKILSDGFVSQSRFVKN